jgi:hypothetical protein
MPTAIEQIVDAYVRLGNRRALEDLSAHRQRLVDDLRGKAGLDVSTLVRQIEEEIAVIDAGLEKLPPSGPAA